MTETEYDLTPYMRLAPNYVFNIPRKGKYDFEKHGEALSLFIVEAPEWGRTRREIAVYWANGKFEMICNRFSDYGNDKDKQILSGIYTDSIETAIQVANALIIDERLWPKDE